MAAGGAIHATVTAANGALYVGTLGHNFSAFDALTGAPVPGSSSTGGAIESTAAIVGGQLFFGDEDFDLYGLDRSTGTAVSGFPETTGGPVISSPAVGVGQITGAPLHAIVGSQDGKIYSYNVTDGSLAWSRSLDGVVNSSPIIANGIVYVNSQNSLYAIDEYSGNKLWRGAVRTVAGYSSPVVSDGRSVYLVGYTKIYAMVPR